MIYHISYKLSLKHLSQVTLISLILSSPTNIDNADCRYGKDYVYPTWAEALGLMMSLSSMVMVPGYAVYYVLTQPGTIMQVSQSLPGPGNLSPVFRGSLSQC